MAIGTIEFESAEDNELEITMRGKPEKVIAVLVSGMPKEALVQLHEALCEEMAKRSVKEQSDEA